MRAMSEAKAPRRRHKFLVVVDDTPEVRAALRFATRRARNVGGGVTLLRAIAPSDSQLWAGVGEIMREEARQEAEKLLQTLADQVQRESGIVPELVIREGHTKDELLALINDALAGQMSGDLRIPITVVPGTLTDGQIDDLT